MRRSRIAVGVGGQGSPYRDVEAGNPSMPENIAMAVFVFGAVLLLISLLGGGFKIFGAEVTGAVGPTGRIIAGVGGAVVLIVGLFGPRARPSPPGGEAVQPAGSSRTAEPPGAGADQFAGHWLNVNPHASGITRVEIERRLNTLSVHVWGACVPTDCDWGTETTDAAEADDGSLSVTWKESFKTTNQQIGLVPDGRLKVLSHTHFTDNSGRPDYNSAEYFARQ
jgi:hypothetical protein